MTPRQFPKEKREEMREQLLQFQHTFNLSYGQLTRYARKAYGIDLTRSGMFHFLN